MVYFLHVPFTHHQQHLNLHPAGTRQATSQHNTSHTNPPLNTTSSTPTQHPPRHLSATSAIKRHQQRPPPTYTTKNHQQHRQKPYIALKATEATHPPRRSWLHLACNHSKFHGLATSPLQACLLAARKYTIFFFGGEGGCVEVKETLMGIYSRHVL